MSVKAGWTGGAYGGRYLVNDVEVARIDKYSDSPARFVLSILNGALEVYGVSRDDLMRHCERRFRRLLTGKTD